jgi:cobalt-zinc-cadmium resistance protein CzcA
MTALAAPASCSSPTGCSSSGCVCEGAPSRARTSHNASEPLVRSPTWCAPGQTARHSGRFVRCRVRSKGARPTFPAQRVPKRASRANICISPTNVRGRDLGSFVSEAQQRVSDVELPTGAYLQWGGQFENLQSASQHMSLIVPICFVLIFGILYMALGTFRAAGAVFTAVPLALAGGVFTLFLTGMPFSISAAVGFICLAGVAVLNGLVVMTSINNRLDLGMPVDASIREGMIEKFRAVLMTGIVPAIGFVPMAIAHGAGAEVQKPLATVVIGGLITATLLTLFVLPAICRLMLTSGHRARAGEMPTAYEGGAPVQAE